VVVLVYGVVLGAETMVFCPVERNSYVLRMVVGGWRYGVVRNAGSGVRVVVVVVCFVGVDMDTGAM
jgi:hypothetical protein